MFYYLFSKLLSISTALAATGGGDNTPSSGATIKIENPLGAGATIETILTKIIDFVVMISIPILSLVVLYAAFLMLTDGGNGKKFEEGKKALLYAIIGFAIILMGEGIVKLLEAILNGTASSS